MILLSLMTLPFAHALPPDHPCEPHCDMDIVAASITAPGGLTGWLTRQVTVTLDDKSTRTRPVTKHIGGADWAIDETEGPLVPAGYSVLDATLLVSDDVTTKVYDLNIIN